MNFSEANIRKLFGSEAAEDESVERLKGYYFKSDVYTCIHADDLPLRILVGHKGIGKSATFKVSYEEHREKKHIAVWIRPDDIMELGQYGTSFLQLIRDWKNGLSQIIFQKVLEGVGITDDSLYSKFLSAGGKLISMVTALFRQTIENNVSTAELKVDVIKRYLSTNKVFVYIDDLDRGWTGSIEGNQRISALLNAARDLTNDNPGLCIRISLRSDVYYLVRTSDESTDKIEGSVIWYSWTQHQLLCMLAKRIQSFLGNRLTDKHLLSSPQFVVAQYFNEVFEERFHAAGKWSDIPVHRMLASMIRRRPRDLVKLCTMVARSAREHGHSKITSDDWRDNFDTYSLERIQDTVNEYRSELPDIERLLFGMKPSKKERHKNGSLATSEVFLYTTEELLRKLSLISEKKSFMFTCGTEATAQDLAAFLYKINFLIARKRLEGSGEIDRKYFEDNKYLSSTFVDFGYRWEVHPAFRWALYPDAGVYIYSSLDTDIQI